MVYPYIAQRKYDNGEMNNFLIVVLHYLKNIHHLEHIITERVNPTKVLRKVTEKNKCQDHSLHLKWRKAYWRKTAANFCYCS